MGFQPIKKRTRIYQTIIQQIKASIAEGKILPGDKLPSERALAEILNVSRTSVKEAITVLESSGIINVRAGVGMFLNDETPKDLLLKFSAILNENESSFIDLIELRQAVEGDAAYYATSRMTMEQRETLTRSYHRLLAVEEKGDIAIEEDYEFHYNIVKSANNPVMLEVMHLVADKIMSNLKASREYSVKNKLLNQQVMREHENIFNAIINNQPEAAEKTMWEHHQGIKQRYMHKPNKNGGIFI